MKPVLVTFYATDKLNNPVVTNTAYEEMDSATILYMLYKLDLLWFSIITYLIYFKSPVMAQLTQYLST